MKSGEEEEGGGIISPFLLDVRIFALFSSSSSSSSSSSDSLKVSSSSSSVGCMCALLKAE